MDRLGEESAGWCSNRSSLAMRHPKSSIGMIVVLREKDAQHDHLLNDVEPRTSDLVVSLRASAPSYSKHSSCSKE
eukprot:2815149-Prymnesium_polylepis.1